MPDKRKRLTLRQKETLRAAYNQAGSTMTLKQICEMAKAHFGCEIHKATASRLVKETRQCRAFQIDEKATEERRNFKPPKHPQLDEILANWVQVANQNNVCITGRALKQKAAKLAEQLNIGDTFSASQGWLYNFQKRHYLWVHRLHGESASTDMAAVNSGRDFLRNETVMYDAQDTYNVDETAIFFKAQPKTSISSKSRSGLKKDKTRLSVALAANASGSHKMPLLFIGKAMRPRCFGTLTADDLNIFYRSNRKAWMTIALFSEWIMKFNAEMKAQGRTVLLILDNASSHKVVATDISNVRVLMLPPNTTSVLQPMDAGIIAAFRHFYKRRQTDHAIGIVDSPVAGEDVTQAQRKNPYAVDVLQAIRWCIDACDEVCPSTIRNCWAHTGIVPSEALMTSFDRLPNTPMDMLL